MEKDGKVGYFNARFRGSDGKLEIDLSSRLDGWYMSPLSMEYNTSRFDLCFESFFLHMVLL